jgi:hypothetical protein
VGQGKITIAAKKRLKAMPPSTANRVMSKRDEHRLITAYRRMVLAGEYPNPDRVGCPGSDILKSMAFRQIDLARAVGYMEHVGCCSPCFTEYTAFRQQVQKIARLRILAVAAMVVIAIGIGSWVWVRSQGRKTLGPPTHYQAVIVDLRDRVVLRGPEEGPPQGPIDLPRAPLALSIYLPIGSEPGDYEVEIVEQDGSSLAGAKGPAQWRDHIAVIEVKLDLRPLHRGLYNLAIRRPGWSRSYYPALLR